MNWDLSEIFASFNELDDFIKKVDNDCKEFAEIYKDKLDNFKDFDEVIKKYEAIEENISKIQTFISLNFALDTTKGAMLSKYEQKIDELYEKILFFEIEINTNLDIDNLIANSKNYKYYLKRLKEAKIHQLSLLEEKLLLKTSPVGARAFVRLFEEVTSKFKFEIDKKEISFEELLSLFQSGDRNLRKKANEELHKILEKNSLVLTFILNMIKTDLKITTDIRKYQFPEDIMHSYNQIKKPSVDALINACEENFDISQNYYKEKSKILGFELFEWDRYAPLFKENQKFSFEEAKKIVLDAFMEFDTQFYEIAKKAFDDNWIDVFPKEAKTTGAFSHSGIKSLHPYVLLNYTGTLRDVFTLAHELGHAVHQFLSYKQSYLNSNTPLTTSECASVFAEMLVFSSLLKTSNNKKALLANKLEDIFATSFRQINFTTFEREIHSFKDELSYDEISTIWLKHSKKMFEGGLKISKDYGNFWSYISHFIHSPFYCYSYAYAQLLVLSIYGIYESGKVNDFAKKYKEILSLAGSLSPEDEMKILGIDINDKFFWNIGLKKIRDLLENFIKE